MVGCGRGHRVKGIGQGDDARLDADPVAFEAQGIAGAVETLVVLGDDVRDAGERLEVLEHLPPCQAVQLDAGILLF